MLDLLCNLVIAELDSFEFDDTVFSAIWLRLFVPEFDPSWPWVFKKPDPSINLSLFKLICSEIFSEDARVFLFHQKITKLKIVSVSVSLSSTYLLKLFNFALERSINNNEKKENIKLSLK